MDLTKKSVLDTEKDKLYFSLASKFLKTMGWWYYWKEYMTTPEYTDKVKGKAWWDVDFLFKVFGQTNFSTFLRTNCGCDITYITPIFMGFIKELFPQLYDEELKKVNNGNRFVAAIYMNYHNRANFIKGEFREKWLRRKTLIETSELVPANQVK